MSPRERPGDRRDLLQAEILRLLERLAEVRRRAGDLEEQLRESEEQRRALAARLEEVRGLVRRSRALSALGAPRADVPFEVVAVGSGGEEWLDELARAGVPTCRVAPPGDGASGPSPASGSSEVRRIDAERTTPAHLWNVALAATEAPIIVLADAAALSRFERTVGPVLADDDLVAAGRLALEGPEGKTFGFGLDDDLTVRPLSAQESDAAVEVVPDPRAFVVRRAAFDRLGPFDEDLAGPLALVEWVLRARAKGFVVEKSGGFVVEAARPVSWAPSGEGTAGEWVERLLVAAARRPAALAAVLLAASRLDELAGERRGAFLAAFVRRLGERGGDEARSRFLVDLASSWAASALDAVTLDPRVGGLERLLSEAGVLPDEEAFFPTPALRLLHRLDRLPGAISALARARDEARREADALRESLEGERRARQEEADRMSEEVRRQREEVRRLREEMERLRGDRDAHLERGRRAEEAAASLHEEVGRVRERLRRLEEERARLVAEVERLTEFERAAERNLREAAARALGLPEGARTEDVLERAARLHAHVEVLLREVSSGLFGRRLTREERRLLGPDGGGGR